MESGAQDRGAGAAPELHREVEELKRRVAALELALGRPEPQQRAMTSTAAATQSEAIPTPAPGGREAEGPGTTGRPSALESRIGAQLFNRIGIFAVLAAAAWFLKLAIDRRWIGPEVRVLIGLMLAAGLGVWAERLRRSGSVAFSYSLNTLASGLAYLSLWASFNLYHLLPSWPVFLAMAGVTATNATLAWKNDSELLAALALAGGLATPALLSMGGDHEIFLFGYLVLLDLGAVGLAALRPWPRVAGGAFAGTAIYFAVWSVRYDTAAELFVTGWFLAIFFTLFTAAPFLSKRKTNSGGAALLDQLPIVVGLGVLAAAFHLAVLNAPAKDVSPVTAAAAASLAVVSLSLVIFAPGVKQNAQGWAARLRTVHLGVAVALLAVAALLRFRGYGIVLCWITELLLLVVAADQLRDGRRSRAQRLDRPLAGNSAAMFMTVVCGLVLLPTFDHLPQNARAIVNLHFLTYLYALAVFTVAMFLGGKIIRETQTVISLQSLRIDGWPFLAGAAVIAFNLIAILAVNRQIDLYWRQDGLPEASSHLAYGNFTHSAWLMFYGALLMGAGFRGRSTFLRWQALVLLIFSIGKVFLFDTSHLTEGYRIMSFLGLGVLLLGVSFAYQRDLLGLRGPESR